MTYDPPPGWEMSPHPNAHGQRRRAFPVSDERLAQLYREGAGLIELAGKLGVARETIRRRLLQAGVVLRRPGGERWRTGTAREHVTILTEEERERLRQLGRGVRT